MVISCSVLEDLLGKRLAEGVPAVWLDIMLHNTPKKLGVTIQEAIDAIAEPSTIVLGYGLCGNGLVGVKAGVHTLVIPRTHDCVAIFLGSHQRYVQRFFASPNTYYLTKGWIDARDEPLADYQAYVTEYDEETADYLFEMKYKHYRKICLVGFSQQELDDYRERALAVVNFMDQRFGGVILEETIGSPALVDAIAQRPASPGASDDEFVVIDPGGEISQELFMRSGECVPQPAGRGERAE